LNTKKLKDKNNTSKANKRTSKDGEKLRTKTPEERAKWNK